MDIDVRASRVERARSIAAEGGVRQALDAGALTARVNVTLSEALVMGLLQQDVRKFIVVLGHGSTEIG